jgi:branched-chain amino acid transport system ATP-binding protein
MQLAGTLSGGEQQMLAIGRAMMSDPKVLMLDEPSLGLAPILARSVLRTVRQIADRGTTVLLVEQNARQALAIAHRAYVIEVGRIVLEGEAAELARDERVQKAYLGGFEAVATN